MIPDPFSVCLFIVEFVRIAYKFHSLEDEIRIYKETFRVVSDLFSDVDSIRKRLRVETNTWIDRELQRIRSALEDAEREVSWMGETRSRVLATMDVVEWSLKHKHAAEAQKVLLFMYQNTLLNIRTELANKMQQRPDLEEYFQETRARTLVVLSKRVVRNAIMYSGVGEQTSRSRLFEPEQQSLTISLA